MGVLPSPMLALVNADRVAWRENSRTWASCLPRVCHAAAMSSERMNVLWLNCFPSRVVCQSSLFSFLTAVYLSCFLLLPLLSFFLATVAIPHSLPLFFFHLFKNIYLKGRMMGQGWGKEVFYLLIHSWTPTTANSGPGQNQEPGT